MRRRRGSRTGGVGTGGTSPSTSAEDLVRLQIDRQADADLYAMYQQALFGVVAAALDRAERAAELVQRAAAAVGTIYAAALGLSFSSGDRPLPAHGLIPAVFLGTAVVCSTVYLAFVTPGGEVDEPSSSPSTRQGAKARIRFFLRWTGAAVHRRALWLRAGVVALSLGVAFLPVAFVRSPVGGPAAPEVAAWPEPPSGGVPELEAVLYEARVDEVAAERRRAREPASGEGSWMWWVLGAAGLGAVVVVSRVGAGSDAGARGRGDPGEAGGDHGGPGALAGDPT